MANVQTSINQLHESEPQWFAIYSAFKKEKYAKKLLEKKGIETYLPLQKVVRKYKSKVKKLEIPLINCYIFVRITKQDYVKVLETDYISRFVKIGKDLFAIPGEEIEVMQRILREDVEIEIEQNRFYQGDEVKITQGNLMGLTGKLVEFHGKEKVVVKLNTIGYSIQMEMDKGLLKKT
ncbi:MAG: UpxY family transcription antiterminator [Saprospiraceae bacterium]